MVDICEFVREYLPKPKPHKFGVLYFSKKIRTKKRPYPSLKLVLFSSARDVGIEPTLEVLETPVLPLYESRLRPPQRTSAGKPAIVRKDGELCSKPYFISLCNVCFLHFGQCFFISNFSFSFFLFLVVK